MTDRHAPIQLQNLQIFLAHFFSFKIRIILFLGRGECILVNQSRF